MIHLLHGKDGYRVRHALAAIRDALAEHDDMLASNTTVLEGRGLTPGELLAHVTAVPFLASHRLVIVEGLLGALGEVRGGRGRKKKDGEDPLAAWREAAARLADPAAVPPTTTLVLLEGELARSNAAFPIFAPIARTAEYAPLVGRDLEAWITSAAKAKKLRLSEGAVRMLADLAAGDLWALDNELDKIAAYTAGEAADEATVSSLVSAARETKVWEVADAVVAGNERKALTSMRRLLRDGEAPPLLLFMIARQYRQLLLVKDLRDRRAGREETLRASGVPPFKLNEVSALAGRYPWPALRAAHRKLLEADLSVKRGLQDDESALQLLVHELCALTVASREGLPTRPTPARRRADTPG